MFYEHQSDEQKKSYEEKLKLIGSLSNLFSDSMTPYLYYRVAEKIFCNSFVAQDLSRGDVAFDAYKNKLGIGLKTFLANNYKSFQKVAEFNKDKILYEHKNTNEIVHIISALRNNRIEFSEKLYGIENSLYHCVLRDKHEFKIYEEKMSYIDIDNISDVKKKKNVVTFNDLEHEYAFNLSKSTLSKRFVSENFKSQFEVSIIKNPLEDIKRCFESNAFDYGSDTQIVDTLYLPLYGRGKEVHPRSALNQWNANGRHRDVNEVYIPIPAKVHQLKKDFFPSRDTPFHLKLPNGDVLDAKVCQDNSKALMSYSNKDLGKWILRDVLSLKEGELLTYAKLQTFGVDSVRIDKLNSYEYSINFAAVDSYEEFIQN